jgi:hypothetical protein
VAGYCTSDQQQVSLGIDANNHEVLGRTAHIAHVPGHFLALEYATRRLVLADRSGRAMRQ